MIVEKARYSAFVGTALEMVLRSTGRDHVVVCGRMVKQWCEAEPRLSTPKKVVGRLVALQFDATA